MQDDVKVDMSEFKRGLDRYTSDNAELAAKWLRSAAKAYSAGAAKYTPPCIGKRIPAKMYRRAIYYLPGLVSGRKSKNVRDDVSALRSGMRWLVVSMSGGKAQRQYFRRQSQAKQASRIANRGLLRAMHGLNLASIGEQLPPAIQTLANRSPRLQRLKHLNAFSEDTAPDKGRRIRIANTAQTKGGSWQAIAVKQGDMAAYRKLKSLIIARNREKVKI